MLLRAGVDGRQPRKSDGEAPPVSRRGERWWERELERVALVLIDRRCANQQGSDSARIGDPLHFDWPVSEHLGQVSATALWRQTQQLTKRLTTRSPPGSVDEHRLGEHWVVLGIGEVELVGVGFKPIERLVDRVDRTRCQRRCVARAKGERGAVELTGEARGRHSDAWSCRIGSSSHERSAAVGRNGSLVDGATTWQEDVGFDGPSEPKASCAVARKPTRFEHVDDGVRHRVDNQIGMLCADRDCVDRFRGRKQPVVSERRVLGSCSRLTQVLRIAELAGR